MNMETGIDIVKIDRLKKYQNNERFLTKYFSQSEIEYINSKGQLVETLAGIYAAKEAFLKSIGIGIGGGISLSEISIIHDKNGKPSLEVTPQIQYYLQKYNCGQVSISISHDGDYAIAICVIK